MKKRSRTQWIKDNRAAIDKYTGSPYHNDSERSLWVDNDEGLYYMQRRNIDL